jgi:hypothetical protein
MGPTALLPLRRKACCGLLSPLKIHCPRLSLNPRTLGPMARMLTTLNPRTLGPMARMLTTLNLRTLGPMARMLATLNPRTLGPMARTLTTRRVSYNFSFTGTLHVQHGKQCGNVTSQSDWDVTELKGRTAYSDNHFNNFSRLSL